MSSTTSVEGNFFSERTLFFTLLHGIVGGRGMGGGDVPAVVVVKVCLILDKYQEQASLLDPFLEEMMEIIVGCLRGLLRECEVERWAAEGEEEEEREGGRSERMAALFQIIYHLCKVRGYKTIVRLLPHEVDDLEPVIHYLLRTTQTTQSSGAATTDSASTPWETRYSLLLWLSMLALIPFDIATIDSSLVEDPAAAVGGGETGSQMSVVDSIIFLSKRYLADAGPTRDAAAVCLSRLLTRPDMESVHLESFVRWATVVLSKEARARAGLLEGAEAATSSIMDVFLVNGVLTTLALLFKFGHREKLVGIIPLIFPHIVAFADCDLKQMLQRKLVVKLSQRIGLCFMPPRVVSWRYQRGQRSLLQNLGGNKAEEQEQATVARSSSAPGPQGTEGTEGEEGEEGDLEKLVQSVPEELDDIVEHLLCGLRDKDTVVRWSAAKGIGRITGRLPLEFADDIVVAVLELFADDCEGDSAWHGGCLALAELARRGLLLPSRLPQAVPLAVKALAYDVRRGQHSVGSHVRDAACYVCWSFARAYSPQVMQPFVHELSTAMLLTSIFDREVNCRRAASAAFQENVGRQGHENFKHGIEILTAADYFTLGNRANAYLEISCFVAKFPTYCHAIFDHVSTVPLAHWDVAIRTLASKAIHQLTALDPRHMEAAVLPGLLRDTVSPSLLNRHGALLGVAEIICALAKVPHGLPPDTLEEVLEVVPRVEKARLYRGRGGEVMRSAVCRLIECIALANPKLKVKQQLRFLNTLDEAIPKPQEDIQRAAVAGIYEFTRSYFPVGANGVSDRLQARIVDKYVSELLEQDNAAATRGFSLALGALPKKLLAASPACLEKVLRALARRCDKSDRVGDEPDAETRRNALEALVQVFLTVGIAGDPSAGAGGEVFLLPEQANLVFDTLIAALDDYSLDNRGDVGSWCRVVAMKGLQSVTPLAIRATRCYPQQPVAATAAAAAGLADPAVCGGGGAGGGAGGGGEKKDDDGDEAAGVFAPGTRVETRFGRGVIVCHRAEGGVYDVRFEKPECHVPHGGVAVLRADAFTHVLDVNSVKAEAREAWLPSMAERTEFLVQGVEGKVMASVQNQTPIEGSGEYASESEHGVFTPGICARVVCGLLKQLCEKLDNVRDCAGRVLHALLSSTEPRVPYVPQGDAVRRLLGAERGSGGEGATKHVNWASPAATFPLMGILLTIPDYHEAVVSGFVISVGGLTESVVKHSSAMLLQWAKALKRKQSGKLGLARFADTLLGLFAAHAKDDRVIVPLFKTLDLLLSNAVFDGLDMIGGTNSENEQSGANANGAGVAEGAHQHPFPGQLLAAVRREVNKCRDFKKLHAAITVVLGLLSFSEPVRNSVVQTLLLFLGHSFAKIRKATAEQLYIKLLEVDGIVEADRLDAISELLLGVVWDGEIDAVRGERAKVAALFGVALPEQPKSARPARRRARKDELESYASLVSEAGY